MIEFLNLKKLNSPYMQEFEKKASDIIKSGIYVLSNEVEKFEKDFAAYQEASYCIGVANGSDALFLILRAYKELGFLKDGDEILLPANAYIATVLSVTNNCLKPIFVEIDETFNIDPNEIKNHITKKTKAILAISLYGQSANFKKLKNTAQEFNLKLIEDAAQAHGSLHYNKKTSHFTDASAFSFYPTKNLGALGDAGAVTTNDKKLFETIKILRNYGSSKKNTHPIKGINSRLDELQAGFLNIKLKYLDKITQKRRDIANFYLKNIKHPDIILPIEKEFNKSVWHLFVIRTKNRKELIEHLEKQEIKTCIHYPKPVYRQNSFKELSNLSFKKTDSISKEILSIPVNESLTKEETNHIVKTINDFIS